jgi:hypothetical protein
MLRESFNRRRLIKTASCAMSCLGVLHLSGADRAVADPWSPAELMRPAELAKRLTNGDPRLRLICVTFPVLYRQKHIARAVLAGPGSKPDGLTALHSALTDLNKFAVVLYCGCCPMPQCPNIRPAFIAAKERGLGNVHVLNLPTNLHTDWVLKGYPVAT